MTEQQEREAFEAWLQASHPGAVGQELIGKEENSPHTYVFSGVNKQWRAWQARAALAAKAVPAGWKLVPVEPTQAMHHAGIASMPGDPNAAHWWAGYPLGCWAAMLAATPPAPAPEATRSQRLAEAGYTRRPSWKSLPKDGEDEPEATPAQALQAEAIAEHLEKHLPTYASKHPSLLVRQLATALMAATKEQLRCDSEAMPVAYADKVAFESAMKIGKGCDVWPKAGNTDRELIALYTAPVAQAKPCRSPYCECEKDQCTHPGFYDARGT